MTDTLNEQEDCGKAKADLSDSERAMLEALIRALRDEQTRAHLSLVLVLAAHFIDELGITFDHSRMHDRSKTEAERKRDELARVEALNYMQRIQAKELGRIHATLWR